MTMSRALSFLFSLLLLLLGAGCVLAVILTAAVFYRSSQGATYQDVESLVKPVAELKKVWSADGELSSLQGVLDKKNQELQTAAAELGSADRQVLVSKLQTISANLSFLQETLKHERGQTAKAVGDLEGKVKALQDKLGSPAGYDRILAVLFKGAGSVFIAVLWPLVLVTIFFYLLRSRHAHERLMTLFEGFKSIKVGLAEIVLADSEKTKARTEDAFASLREQAKLQYDLWVQRKSIREKLEEVVDEVAAYFSSQNKTLPNYRCTLHVPDIVFADTLYQLLDYLPTGGGRGRVFSVRFGIIGKVWRLFLPETQGGVPQAALDEIKLVQEWGMTKEEAKRAARDRPSFLCVPLKDEAEGHVGMFYMDSPAGNAFEITGKKDSDLHDFIFEKCRQKSLIQALAKMKDELSGRAPLIRVYEK